MLKSQLFGRARDLCTGIPDEVLNSSNGADAIKEALYQRNALTVVREVFIDFNDLISTRRSATESLKIFENRFAAQVAKFNTNG